MQDNLFGKTGPLTLSIEEAADEANVSTATIRNWIKTGYLSLLAKRQIELNGFQEFMTNVVGNDKLIQRANKLMRDAPVAPPQLIINKDCEKPWSVMGQEYEGSLSNSYKNKEGIYYTPNVIIDQMLADIPIDAGTTFLDPCCGSGNFIIQAIRNGVKPENAFGFDLDSNAVEITKNRIFEEFGFDASGNIKQLDFLESSFQMQHGNKYDLVFTNPPWGKKIPKKDKERYARFLGAGTSIDTTSLFYFASIGVLKKNGILGFLVQDALFNIGIFQDTRNHILKNNLIRLVDYGKPFKGLLTKVYAFILEYKEAKNKGVHCESSHSKHTRNQSTFAHNPKSIFNFWATQEENEAIEHLCSMPFTTLRGNAQWGLGIVTGNNKKFCLPKPAPGYVPVFKGSDITSEGLKTPSCFIPSNFSQYQQVAPIHLYQAKKKLLYRFISSKLVFFCDTEQRFILNSANFLIPHQSLAITCHQLADLLSSDFMNWLFTSLFRTHKVLRGDLEQLPIHQEYFRTADSFDEEAYINFLGLTKSENGTYRVK